MENNMCNVKYFRLQIVDISKSSKWSKIKTFDSCLRLLQSRYYSFIGESKLF